MAPEELKNMKFLDWLLPKIAPDIDGAKAKRILKHVRDHIYEQTLKNTRAKLKTTDHPTWRQVSAWDRKLAYHRFELLASNGGVKMGKCVGSWATKFLAQRYWKNKYDEWKRSGGSSR